MQMIDVDVLWEQMKKLYQKRSEESNMTGDRAVCVTWNDAVFCIKNSPTIDAVPVVRGKWSIHEIYKHEMSYGATGYEPVYRCSVCGSLMESYLRFDEPIMPEDADFPRYCPNCGAKMDKDGDAK